MVAKDGPTGGADLEVHADDVMATKDSPNEDAESVYPLRLVPMQANDVEMGEFIDFLMNDTHPPEQQSSYELEASTSGHVEVVEFSSTTCGPSNDFVVVEGGIVRVPFA
ncbi:hypothetical protein ACE6H2_006859 [Prunus campanulata]